MNRREMKRRLKRRLASYLLENEELEEWASINLQVNKTETTMQRWHEVKMALFKDLFGEY